MTTGDRESEQLVAAAISAADLLVEINRDGVIIFITGAVHRLGINPAQTPVGLSLFDLFQANDQPAARKHVSRIAEGGTIDPVELRFRRGGVPSMLFGGCALPQGRTILFMGIGETPDPRIELPNLFLETQRGLMSRPVFTALALRRIPEDLARGLSLTLLEIGGYAALDGHVKSGMLRGFPTAIAHVVRISSSGLEAVGELGRGRFGVLHRGALHLDDIKEAIHALIQAVAPGAPLPSLATATLDPLRDALFGRHASRVLRLALERFSANEQLVVSGVEDPGLGALFPDTVKRVANLEHVIENGAFDLAYQPVVDLSTRATRHLEALVRFQDGSASSAGIVAAEIAGMIADFDLEICVRAIERIEETPHDQLPVAVNLSGRSIESRGFVERLRDLLDGRRVPPTRLMFELTETAILGEVEHINEIVQVLRQCGFRFCLDDLGSGANSFHFLRSIDVDFVKIDGVFGRDALDNQRDRSFLRYVAGFCRENAIVSIAEMVETEDQARQFQEIGIDYGQGSLFGQPTIGAA
jgi:EAL domain-containing protein (putative c-di-GMP-specific phosphodiesterase class I)